MWYAQLLRYLTLKQQLLSSQQKFAEKGGYLFLEAEDKMDVFFSFCNCSAITNYALTGHFEWYRQHKQGFGALPSKRHKPACSKRLSWHCDEQL